jgi:hypothetical protein
MARIGAAAHRTWLAVAGVVLVGVVAALVAVPSVLAKPKHDGGKARHPGSCNAHRKRASVVAPRVVVYAKAGGVDQLDSTVTTYYACVRPAGAPMRIGDDAVGDGEYPPNETTYGIRVAGTYVAALSSSGAAQSAACSKFEPSADCPAVSYWIEALDARTHRRLRLATGPSVTALAVSPAGAVAWIEQPTSSVAVLYAVVLHRGPRGRLAGTVQSVDMGTIHSRSLGLRGLRLSWTNSDRDKSLTLR